MLLTITNSGLSNGRPTSIGSNSFDLGSTGTHVFSVADFTTDTSPAYSDPEEDSLKYIKITQTLEGNGSLKLNGTEVSIGQLVYAGDISSGNLIYDTPSVEEDEAYSDVFKFDCADSGSSSLSGLDTGVITINIAAKANQPADSVGDGTVSTAYATTIVFTRADFTTSTSPQYSDPEGDVADKLKILTLPSAGVLQFNNSNVSANQIITFDEIDAGYFQYVPSTLVFELQQESFNFAIADAGSGIFVE
tara:strand:+ start:8637 stop:9380 length:744 start_codon:yes stop_codon:yes gene_type:complete